MDKLVINSGVIRLEVTDELGNSRGVFKFNPSDVAEAERLHAVYKEFDVKQKEFEERSKEVETSDEVISFLLELVDYIRNLIDNCYGAGTSELLFGDMRDLDMFNSFFEGITPYYEKASKSRTAKYKKVK